MSDIKLRPCPFCGGKVEMYVDSVDAYNNSYNFWCNNCNMITTYQYSDEEKAIETWNSRKPMERIMDRLENEEKGIAFLTLANTGDRATDIVYNEVMAYLDAAIRILKEECGGRSIEV